MTGLDPNSSDAAEEVFRGQKRGTAQSFEQFETIDLAKL